MIDHPRFGKIRSIVVLKDLPTGQELFCDYGYMQQYVQSENMMKAVMGFGKWWTNMEDEEFRNELKYHIHYVKDKVDKVKPYISLVKGVMSNFT